MLTHLFSPVLLIKKFQSAIVRLVSVIRTRIVYLCAFSNPAIVLAKKCHFGKGIVFSATDGGVIRLGQGVCVGDYSRIVAKGGSVVIEDNVEIGVGSIIVSREGIRIMHDSLIAEYVVIRDQDHRMDSRPIRAAGFDVEPINIGRDVWIGAKATVLRGSMLGDHCVIGAHSLVNSDIPANWLAVGTPARPVRQIVPSRG